ncbi:MAG: valine--tRNA ligase, partial [Phycisphaerales bacterium]
MTSPSETRSPQSGKPHANGDHAPVGSSAGGLPKAYNPSQTEPVVTAKWDASGAFHADPMRVVRGEARPYGIFIPPPNVTAALHLGHALNNTLQDTLVRAHRMMGFETLWMPGTDHAGIATQAVVEKRLRKEGKLKGALKDAMKREEFVAHVQAFKDEYEATITAQLKEMGASCDWARQRFTMDDQCAAAVREAFFRLFKDGLIYRGKRLVNWDPALQTAVADDECYDEEIDAAFYYLRYPLVHKYGQETERERLSGGFPPDDAVPVTWSELATRGYPGAENHPPEQEAWITVATTRPETYLGDTAVAVNPHDPRAKALRHLSVELPLVGRVIPIIEDGYVVLPAEMQDDPEEAAKDPKAAYATGFLKVTPAHDPNDWEIGQRHGLTAINVMAPDATISDKHGWSDIGDAHIFVGKKREEARKLSVKEFEARGLLEGVKPYRHSVKHSDRSKAIVEPYLSDQWYVRVTDPRMASSANRALVAEQSVNSDGGKNTESSREAAGDGSLRFHPARYAKTYQQWHDNIRDWCISRQLWWGHRIPVWSHANPHPDSINWLKTIAQQVSINSVGGTAFVCLRSNDPLIENRLESFGFVQDPDVLDTWFSSALWPLSTLGWPDPAKFSGNEGMLEAFNPSSVLCTAREIITLWVSRMVMFNRYFTGDGQGRGPVPFKDVFIHAMIQDGEGRKMSKSLGNGVDPRDIIESHGADAMRFTLVQMTTNTQDVRMPVQKDGRTGKNTSPKFDNGRNFCNKLWNTARFVAEKLARPAPLGPRHAVLGPADLSLLDRWMLSRLASTVKAVNAALAGYEFSDYAEAMYKVLWWDLCDWYLEGVKPTVESTPAQQAVLAHALETIVRLLHPITPFITEAIWEHIRTIETRPIADVTLAPPRKAGLLCTAGWPEIDGSWIDPAAETEFERVRELVSAVRNARSAKQVAPKRRITLHAPAGGAAVSAMNNVPGLVETLCGLERVETDDSPSGATAQVRALGADLVLSNIAD